MDFADSQALPHGRACFRFRSAADELAVFHIHHDGALGRHVPGEDAAGDECLHTALQVAAQGPGTVEGVEAPLNDEALGAVCDLESQRALGQAQWVPGRGRPACAPPAAAAVRACAGWSLVCRWVLVSAPALKAAPCCGRGARSGRPCWKGEGGRPPLVLWSSPSPNVGNRSEWGRCYTITWKIVLHV